MENLDVGFLREKLDLDLYFVFRKHWVESKITEIHHMPTRDFLIEILLHRYNAEHTKIIFFIYSLILLTNLKKHLVRTFTVS